MNYVIFVLTVLLCTMAAVITVDKVYAEKIRFLRQTNSEEEFVSKSLTKGKKWVIVLGVSLLSAVAAFYLAINTEELLNQVKMSVALICLAGAGVNDYREHRIPNIFPLIMAATGVICLLIGVIIKQNGATMYIVSSAFSTVGVAVCMILAAVLSKGGIGMGDIKLMCALSLIGGVYVICGTIFFGMVGCVCAAVFLLLSKKKTLKEAVPFGPFLYIGYVTAIVLSIY